MRREWRAGQYRYFPEPNSEAGEAGAPQLSGQPYPFEELVTGLPNDCIEYIDALLKLQQFNSRRDVVVWLIRKGMESVRVS